MEGYYLVPIVVVPSLLAFILAIGPFRKALAQRLSGTGAASAEVEALGESLAEQGHRLAAAERRVEQLEERLDFTERLLSQRAERARLAEPD